MRALFLALLAAAASAQGPSLRERMLAAEDARAAAPAGLAPLLQGLRAAEPGLVTQAVRALGRLERPDLVPQILPLAGHVNRDVRAEALNALGQSLAALPRPADGPPLPPESAVVLRTLLARVKAETDPLVAGVAAETLGRLPFRTADSVLAVENALASMLPALEHPPAPPALTHTVVSLHPAAVTGALKGLETRIRVYRTLAPPAPDTVTRLRAAATYRADSATRELAFLRRLAWSALNGARAADAALVDGGLDDPDPQVRRLAVLALDYVEPPPAGRASRLTRALRDASHLVRYDAVRVYHRTAQAAGCAPLLAALEDRSTHVVLAALDALGHPCPAGPSPAAELIRLADTLASSGTAWHRPAQAIVALSRADATSAQTRLAVFARHPAWQVRMYAARAAGMLKDRAALARLAADERANVSEAAIAALTTLGAREADEQAMAALARADYQLLLTAAAALKGTPQAERAVPALVDAFTRITAEGRDTSRDTRMALLERVEDLGRAEHAPALRACLADFDPVVARRCAGALRALTGASHEARPAARQPAPLAAIDVRRAAIVMQRGGAFELRLFPDEAPATVARFVRLARAGYYNGLTFHRVVPNFVLQGGSPGANEYMGDGPFMRDELGLRTHARGTLGISTRGRDTGDAQIFINLVDNPRLDHNYTVFADVAAGMDVVDGIVEGDVIARIDVLEPASSRPRR